MRGETDEVVLRGGGGVSLETDDQKTREYDKSRTTTESKPFPMMPVDLLESCLGNKNVTSESSDNDKVGSDCIVTDDSMNALKKAENSSDIQMIDDDDGEEEEYYEDDDEDTGSVIEYETESSSDSEESSEPPTVIVEEAEVESKDSTKEEEEKQQQQQLSMKKQLKSVLKKGTERKNKGLKVTFHDTQIFLIDTEMEVSAGPQLLTVRSFDLPLALSDIRVFTPTFDFVPSLPPGSYDTDHRHYTYEDAIVSFDDYDDVVVCRSTAPTTSEVEVEEKILEKETDQNASENRTNNSDPVNRTDHNDSVNLTDRNDSVNLTDRNDTVNRSDRFASNSDCPLLAALQQESIQADNEPVVNVEVPTTPTITKTEEKISETSQPNKIADEAVQSLTEANLKQHEILMEKDILVTEEDSVVPVTVTSIPTTTNTTSKPNSLSPPLKELTVDVQVVPGVEGLTDDWQVELSPLNSIPESETESSTSSQDTIIMMTSDESRRNEKHIQQSMDSFRKQKQDDGCGNVDAASTGSSQDSDETLKQTDEPQKTSDQIRQILERNADRRNRISYSNIKKKNVDGTPVEKQRQWKSHESLLDTIKKLTLDEVHDIVDGSRTSSNSSEPTISSSSSSNSLRQDLSKLSPQQVTDLIASPIGVQNLLRARHEASKDVTRTKADVPGDVRQWKIRSSLWNSLGNIDDGFTNRLPMKNTDSTSSLPYINGRTDEFRDTAEHNGGQVSDDTSDELLQFVRQDSERIERIRKRYSYTDGDDYETVGSFARRSSVRGIKPRFGSTNEILKQMQSQLQPPPLSNPSNVGSHMTWPYPNTMTESSRTSTSIYEQNSLPSSRYGTRHASTLPVLQEEIYGTTRTQPQPLTTTKPETQPRIPTYSVRNDYQPVYRTRRGRENCYGNYAQVFGAGSPLLPPPYQPPPPPPPYQAPPPPPPPPIPSSPPSSQPQQVPLPSNQSSPTKLLHSKDERGVPEGASSSPKVLFDSMYRHRHHPPAPNSHPVPQYSMSAIVSKDDQCHHQQITDNNGCVYYVMQV